MTDRRFACSRRAEYSKRIDEPVMVETAVRHAGVMRVAKEVVGAIGTECVPGDDLRQQLVPRSEVFRVTRPILQADRHLRDVERVDGWLHRRPDLPHLFAQDHVD